MQPVLSQMYWNKVWIRAFVQLIRSRVAVAGTSELCNNNLSSGESLKQTVAEALKVMSKAALRM